MHEDLRAAFFPPPRPSQPKKIVKQYHRRVEPPLRVQWESTGAQPQGAQPQAPQAERQPSEADPQRSKRKAEHAQSQAKHKDGVLGDVSFKGVRHGQQLGIQVPVLVSSPICLCLHTLPFSHQYRQQVKKDDVREGQVHKPLKVGWRDG
jgi:hypothetical protein